MPTPADDSWRAGDPPKIDPTTLTTELIDRATKALEEKFEAELAIRDERLRGIDVATTLRLDMIHSMPEAMVANITHLREIVDERLDSVATQFKERDTRSERESRDNKLAVDAAFAAQEKQAAAQNKANAEAIGKSETATAETISANKSATDASIEKLAQLFATSLGAVRDQIEDVKGRLNDLTLAVNDIRARGIGGHERTVDNRASIAAMGAVVALTVGVVALLALLGFKK
jgi:cation transport regulator ChaB